MKLPPDTSQRLLADSIQVGSDGRSDVYPALFLYGCGCWLLIFIVGFFVWRLW